MPSLQHYTEQSAFSDPREHAALVAELPADPAKLTDVVRNVIVHYWADGVPLAPCGWPRSTVAGWKGFWTPTGTDRIVGGAEEGARGAW